MTVTASAVCCLVMTIGADKAIWHKLKAKAIDENFIFKDVPDNKWMTVSVIWFKERL